MTNTTVVPLQNAYKTTLSSTIDSSTTTITVADAPSFTVPVGKKIPAVIDPKNSFREVVYITAISGNDLTVERGKADYDGGGSTANTHSAGATLVITNHFGIFDDFADAIDSKLDSDGGNTTTTFDMQVSGSNFRVRLDSGDMKLTDDNQSEVTLSTLAAGGGADEKTKVSNNDTTAGYLNGKLIAGTNIAFTENNDGSNETLTINASSANTTVTTHATYTPAYLTGGNAPETTIAIWDSVSDGAFQITIDGVARSITGLNFNSPAVTSMAEVAAVIQAGIRAVTSSTETCTWSGTEFVISSVNTTASSAITVTTAGASGTDISGAGAGAYMDCDGGSTAAVTAAVLDPTADDGKVPELNSNGNVDTNLLQEVIVDGGYTAKGELVAATAASTPGLLSVGNNGDVLTADSSESTGLKWIAPNVDFMGLGASTGAKTYMQVPLVNFDSSHNVWDSTGAGTFTRTLTPGGVHLNATGTSGFSYLETQNGVFVDMSKANNVLMFDSTFTTLAFEASFQLNASALGEGDCGLGFAQNATGVLTNGSTARHVGFNIDSSGDLYASNGDNSTNTNTNIGTMSAQTWYTVKLEWEKGVEARFYLDGVLAATHTTNLPSAAADIQFAFGVYETSGTSEMGFMSGVLGLEI